MTRADHFTQFDRCREPIIHCGFLHHHRQVYPASAGGFKKGENGSLTTTQQRPLLLPANRFEFHQELVGGDRLENDAHNSRPTTMDISRHSNQSDWLKCPSSSRHLCLFREKQRSHDRFFSLVQFWSSFENKSGFKKKLNAYCIKKKKNVNIWRDVLEFAYRKKKKIILFYNVVVNLKFQISLRVYWYALAVAMVSERHHFAPAAWYTFQSNFFVLFSFSKLIFSPQILSSCSCCRRSTLYCLSPTEWGVRGLDYSLPLIPRFSITYAKFMMR